MARVLCVGVAVVDFVFRVDRMPVPGEKMRAEGATIVGGGCAANAAVAVARLGGEAVLASRLGDDEIGDMILRDLAAEGVDCSMVDRAAGARSPYSSVYVDAAGERQIVSFRDHRLRQDPSWIADAPPVDAVLADTRWAPGAAAAMHLARDRGVPGILDGEAPLEPSLLDDATHVVMSEQGLASFGRGTGPEALAAVAAGVRGWIAVTEGAGGVLVADGTRVPARKVEVVDTLGAGDIWHGAFALRLAEGADPIEAARFANAAATLKCRTFGGRAGCPDRTETEEFMKEAERCS